MYFGIWCMLCNVTFPVEHKNTGFRATQTLVLFLNPHSCVTNLEKLC